MKRQETKTKKVAVISTEEFDRKFDAGDDISDYVDWGSAIKKVNVDFPMWMVDVLDKEAERLSIPRQAVIKTWIDESLQRRLEALRKLARAHEDGHKKKQA